MTTIRGTRIVFGLVVALCTNTLTAQATAQTFTTIYNVPPDVAPSEIGSDTQLNLLDGGSLGNDFNAGATDGTSTNIEVNINGGTVGSGFRARSNSIVNIRGGAIGSNFVALDKSTVNIDDGLFEKHFNADINSIINIRGGFIGDHSRAFGIVNMSGGTVSKGFDIGDNEGETDAIINMTGGIIGNDMRLGIGAEMNLKEGEIGNSFFMDEGSTFNMTGGSVGPGFQAFGKTINISGGSIAEGLAIFSGDFNIHGNSFILNGADITPGLTPNVITTITDRDVILSGILADGSPFSYELNSTYSAGSDYFNPHTELTVALVPEPGTLGLIALGSCGLLRRKQN